MAPIIGDVHLAPRRQTDRRTRPSGPRPPGWLPILGLALLVLAWPAFANADSSASVTVDTGTVLGRLPATALGVNTAAWDPHLLDASVVPLLRQVGVNALRFPGGSTADFFHWQSQSITVGAPGTLDPADTFDAFMSLASQSGAPAIVTVNYGSNPGGTAGADPAEAAAWVRYAKAKEYSVAYWEIGNEIYGNGYYSTDGGWEKDAHSLSQGPGRNHDPALSPAAYALNAAEFIRQMKAADSSAKVSVVLTAPGNWPDDQSPGWNRTVLSQLGSRIDAVSIHWYPQQPGKEGDTGLLDSTHQVAGMVAVVRSLINQYCGANAARVQILVTETNSVSFDPGKQTVSRVNALFLADSLMTWLENGVASVDVWDLHEGPHTGDNNSSGLFGGATFGDFGLLSIGIAPEPSANMPLPAYYGLQMLSILGKPGDQSVPVASSQPLLSAHAVLQAGGGLALLLVNKDPNNVYSVNISLGGYAPADTGMAYSYSSGSSTLTSATITSVTGIGAGGRFALSLPPYSLTTLVLKPRPSVATAAFSSSASSSPTTVAPRATAAITCTVTDTGGPFTGLVDCEIYDASGIRAAQKSWDGQAFAAGQSRSYSFPWVAPSALGAYTIKVGTFQPGWGTNVTWNANAGQVTVTASPGRTDAFSLSAGVSPLMLAPGGTAAIRATVQNTGTTLAGGIVDLEVWNSAGQRVGQQYYAGQNLAAGDSTSYSWNWRSPVTPGVYTLKIGVFTAGWKALAWNDGAATVSVVNADASQYNFEAGTQGWVSSGGMISAVASTGTQPYAGAKSLAVTFRGTAADTQRVFVPLPPITAGKVVAFHVWIPAGSAISTVQPYVLQGASGNWAWTGNWQPASALTPGAWNTLSITVPTGAAPVDSLGVEFSADRGWTGTCYIDAVKWL